MDSVLSESLIGVLAPPPPPEDYSNSETASCLDKPSSSRLFTANLCKRYDQQTPAAISHQANFRAAVLSIYAQYQFINGIDPDLDSHDEEQTETTEEANVPSRYYCYQCRQVVSVTVDGEITCPLCQAGWIQECGGVSLLYLMPSESELSLSNGNVTPGHTWSPFHSIGSHDYDNYDEPQQETVMLKTPKHNQAIFFILVLAGML